MIVNGIVVVAFVIAWPVLIVLHIRYRTGRLLVVVKNRTLFVVGSPNSTCCQFTAAHTPVSYILRICYIYVFLLLLERCCNLNRCMCVCWDFFYVGRIFFLWCCFWFLFTFLSCATPFFHLFYHKILLLLLCFLLLIVMRCWLYVVTVLPQWKRFMICWKIGVLI